MTHFTFQDEIRALKGIQELLSYIPQNCEDNPPLAETREPSVAKEDLNKIMPDEPSHPYDMREVLEAIVDDQSFFEVHKDYAEKYTSGLCSN